MDAQQQMAEYCDLLYNRFGMYEEVAQATRLDRRTVTKYVLPTSREGTAPLSAEGTLAAIAVSGIRPHDSQHVRKMYGIVCLKVRSFAVELDGGR
ncbi:hypothetical protein [Oryzomonas rubra]|uniref:Uncharacterized protein n=1 Tax=Oryzomonas rubra TaxID=2509454 RepID=A0A5A9X7Q9_9BACT|nr:hypothetical protein [Oryzomonas rubra]KAA0888683.1 hypothetical protein ET418_14970 [Oryzomonas rubra]